ncbi:MAG TPA: DUF3857 domain-containing protein [Fulvivirga sp.]|nr:DUF3857 domain-containing protein [Fulvivirga sp.]
MNKYFVTLLLIVTCVGLLSGQPYLKYEWKKDRKLTQLTDEQNNAGLVQVKYHQQYEYVYEGVERQLYIYQTEHQITKVNNDNAVSRSNRIYIPMRDVIELVDLQARTITPDGRTIVLDKSEIKEVEDEETGTGYKIFAIEGAEVGSEIEYYYTKKSPASYFGREFLQFPDPVLKATFVLISPGNLEFAFKSYNGFPEVVEDEAEGKHIYTINATNIPALKKEDFSSYNNSRQRLEFKLAYNQSTKKNLFKWTDAAHLLYSQAFIITKDETKLLNKLLNDMGLKQYAETKTKVAAIENYIKTNFYFDENASGQASDLSFMVKNKIGSRLGMAKLMLNCIKLIGVEPQLVLTSGRDNVAFDGDFETFNYLQDYLLYLPEDQAFIAPYSPEFRYGMVPAELTACDGLFVSEMNIDNIPFPKAEIKRIPALAAKDNIDKMVVNVTFNDALTSNNVTLKRSFNGYSAAFIKSVYPLIEEERKQELLKSLVKFLATDANISSLALEKSKFEFQTWASPLVVESEFQSPSFIEMAGNIILLKAGELIGPQSELYQENERMTEVQNQYNRAYDRSITINIPEGYKIENLDDLIFDEKVVENDREIFYFRSNYELKNNVLKVQVDEAYEEIYYPKEKFEAFRKVINAAADWNKIVLVMSQK